jgi:hypothetical protein
VASRAAAMLLITLTLSGCSGQPSESEMRQAVQGNQSLRDAQAVMAMANTRLRHVSESAKALMAKIAVETGSCAEAQGVPGYASDFRLGAPDAQGKVQYGAPLQRRLFEAGNGWSVEAQQ